MRHTAWIPEQWSKAWDSHDGRNGPGREAEETQAYFKTQLLSKYLTYFPSVDTF